MAKKKILSGHKKVGKKFIPPITQNAYFREINWTNDIVPELVWIGVIQEKLGTKLANEALVELHTEFVKNCDSMFSHSFFSSYEALEDKAKSKFKSDFKKNKYFEKIREGLIDLQYYYPHHPLQFLFDDIEIKESDVDLEIIRTVIGNLAERRTKPATIVQGTVLFNSLVTGKMKIPIGHLLWEINEIDNYPNSDKSRQLASSIRAMINAFMHKETRNSNCEWVNSFWRTSYKIDPPKLNLT